MSFNNRQFSGQSSFRNLTDNENKGYSSTQYTNDAGMEYMSQEANKLAGSSRHMDEIIEMGQSSLQELAAQRHMLKSTQRRLLDIANSLGLSQSVMRFIERRGNMDKYILYGGMAITLLIILLLIYYF